MSVGLGVGVSLGGSVAVALAVADRLGLRVAVALGGKRVAEGSGIWVDTGAQAVKNTVKMSTIGALFSMSALYQPSKSANFACLVCLPDSVFRISSNILSMLMRRLCFVLLCLLLTACQESTPPTSLPTLTLPIQSPTATRDWFPRTATPEYSPVPMDSASQSAVTAELVPPAPGKVLIEDPLRADQWYLLAPTGGRVSLQERFLSMAADRQKLNFEANSKLILPPQFFLLLKVEISTCAPDDYYSLSFWKGSNLGTYVLDFNCQGQMRLRNLQESGSKLLYDWTGVRKLAPLPPTNNLIGVWAIADRVDIFANGQFQYEILTKTSNGGGFGLGFSTTGTGLSSISFSQLGIFEP